MLGVVAFTLCCGSFVNGQSTARKAYKVLQKTETGNAAFIRYDEAVAFDVNSSWEGLRTELQLSANDKLKLIRTSKPDNLGFTHYRYQQYHNGIEVWGAEYIFHVKNGTLSTANGKVAGGLKISPKAALNEKAALNKALKSIGKAKYRWQDNKAEKDLKKNSGNRSATYYPKGKLIIAPLNGDDSDIKNLRLCWVFDVAGTEMHEAWTVYVDAATGEIINTISAIQHGGPDVPGKAKTYYHGVRNITCQYNDQDSAYILYQDKTRGPASKQIIYVVNYNGDTNKRHVNFDTMTNVMSDSTYFLNDSIANEIYYGLEQTYDFYKSHFNRNSLDDKGRIVMGLAHYGKKYANAFWSQWDTIMYYGDGDNVQLNPVVGIDVSGHELTHGITMFTAGLVYTGESGALNESFSDIMGTGIEFDALGPLEANYDIGEGVVKRSPFKLRSMSKPKTGSPRQPNTFKKQFWVKTSAACNASNDYCGVHTNSSIQNLWFYLLAHGDTGTNDNKLYYDIKPIGMEKALQISYRNLVTYLTKSSKYIDARNMSIQSAIDLYGATSPIITTVKEAWCAVGICDSLDFNIGIEETAKNATQKMNVFPNPAQGFVNIDYRSPLTKSATLYVMNINGAEIFRRSIQANVLTTLPTNMLPAGIYTLRLIAEDATYNEKLIVE